MSEPNFLDAFGLSVNEVINMQSLAHAQTFSDKGRLARFATAQRTREAGAYIAQQLWECRQILSKVGIYKRVYLIQQEQVTQPTWEQILERIYDEPVATRNGTIWLLFHACLQAERDFSLDVCPAHSREDVLTGRLLEGIKAACTIWAEASSSYLNRIKNTLEISSIDLTVGGGEQETGGDFALILDIKENASSLEDSEPDITTLTGERRGDAFVPLVFQAKRYVGSNADISQKHDTRGYQFNSLRQVNCASNYIFYENDKEHISTPALPMVKPVSACKAIETSRVTGVFSESVDFATYILRAANGFSDIPAARTREDALNMILANTSPSNVSRLTILGNTSDLSAKYRDALRQLQTEIKEGIRQESPQDDLSDDTRLSSFEP
ncbi:hypothetical protein [Paraburkholderia megapolitana]|uniref:Uncharacterized protein n=1 Tax=Paraburkholderia megapolitana TaxID=420953 RepID=A0A1I3GIS5_9BURK|nr:hypothetical protein [Paraburkholderia megapolitana]QDQ82910.1 hypothetical protein FNZ07_16865 [Paraburkholderia megapolitana]SFI23061.1 hypothetical protein SAMN05192543_102524 [Paraburkholderia megapolitana]